jgi:hypothetical protein
MRLALACACALGVCMAVSADGHHSGAGYDRHRSVTLEGTVRQFKWANPHSWIQIEVPSDAGGTEIWNVEMASTGQLGLAGWDSTTVKPGDKMTIVARPMTSGIPGGLFVSATLPDGRTLGDSPRPRN